MQKVLAVNQNQVEVVAVVVLLIDLAVRHPTHNDTIEMICKVIWLTMK